MSGEDYINDTGLLEHDDTQGLVRQVSAQAGASIATSPLRRLRTSHKLMSVGTLLVVALVVVFAKIAMSTNGPAMATPTDVMSRVEKKEKSNDTNIEKDVEKKEKSNDTNIGKDVENKEKSNDTNVENDVEKKEKSNDTNVENDVEKKE